MKIYTEETYIKEHESIPNSMSAMLVFKEDLEIISNQPLEILITYLEHIDLSIKDLTNNRTPTVKWSNKKKRIEFLKKPFRLFNVEDPRGTHHRFSLFPYHKNIRNKYDLRINSLTTLGNNGHKFIKHNYYSETPVLECLSFYRSFISNLILEKSLATKDNAKNGFIKI